ncbi:hypothetical protein [Dactylosporangium cerinum]
MSGVTCAAAQAPRQSPESRHPVAASIMAGGTAYRRCSSHVRTVFGLGGIADI